ncbi:MAG: response regulator [Myxococcota bacterium]|nr:response regulator [Myxococcota bacterium]
MNEAIVSRILTVEDSDNIRRMIAYNLERAGYDVLQAANGKDAVRILQKNVPDLIILDVRMPEMNGFQLLELMRKYPKAAAIPVIMLSALSQPENIDRAIALGVVDYIVKPLDPTVLLAKVKEALSHRPDGESRWAGPDRRQFKRVKLDGTELRPQPGGRALDLSEGGLCWRTKSPPAEGDVMIIEAHQLFELVGIGEQTLRARVAYVRPEGLGYFRVGAAFIGLPSNSRDTIRRFVKSADET